MISLYLNFSIIYVAKTINKKRLSYYINKINCAFAILYVIINSKKITLTSGVTPFFLLKWV